MSCASITDLANSIHQDIGSPTDTPVSYIQSKLVTAAFLGKLNVLTDNCYTVVTGDIVPALGTDEQAIYALMYEVDFYTRKVNALMGGTDLAWTRLTDGDSTIVRSSNVDVARLYRDMQKQLNDQLRVLVTAYRQAGAGSRSVDYYDIDPNWNAGLGNGNGGSYLQG